MRRRLVSGAVLLSAAAILAGGCNNPPATIPTQPSPVPVTETFSGTLSVNGGITFPFIVASPGVLTGVLTTLAPDPLVIIGIALGTYTGGTCQLVLTNDDSSQGATITGVVNAQGALCARVYDSKGQLTQPVTFTITVAHF